MPTREEAGISLNPGVDLHKVGVPFGLIAVIVGASMLVPAAIDLYGRNPDWRVFGLSALIVAGIGGALALTCYRPWQGLSLRECFVLVVVSWVGMSFAGALPLMLTTGGLSLTDAFFEAASGYTTTGSTVMTGLDHLPPGILMWRSMMQWIGGFGIIGLGILLLPFLGVGGLQLFRLESSDNYEKTVARVRVFAWRLVSIYVVLTGFCALSYASSGMSVFDAVNHAMTTLATGGFSTHDASLGYFHSTALLWFSSLFMILGSLPFSLYARLFDNYRTNLLDDIQVRAFLGIVLTFDLCIVGWLVIHQHMGLGKALTQATFNLVSIISTCGYASTDYLLWGTFPVAIIVVATLFGGCTGSTAGGIKIFRLVLAWKAVSSIIKEMRFPDGVFPMRIGGRRISDDVALSGLTFIVLYIVTLLAFTVAVGLTGVDLATSFSGVAECMANVGPGIGKIIGPAGNFASLPSASKWLFAASMIIGRLELGAAYVLLMPSFWRV